MRLYFIKSKICTDIFYLTKGKKTKHFFFQFFIFFGYLYFQFMYYKMFQVFFNRRVNMFFFVQGVNIFHYFSIVFNLWAIVFLRIRCKTYLSSLQRKSGSRPHKYNNYITDAFQSAPSSPPVRTKPLHFSLSNCTSLIQ